MFDEYDGFDFECVEIFDAIVHVELIADLIHFVADFQYFHFGLFAVEDLILLLLYEQYEILCVFGGDP